MMVYGNPNQPNQQEIRHQQTVRHTFTRSGVGAPVSSIKTVLPKPELRDAIRVVMQAHGGDMTVGAGHCLFTFPAGTLDYELWPRLDSERLDVVFPDGYTIRQIRPRRGYSILSFPLDSFPEEIRALHTTEGST